MITPAFRWIVACIAMVASLSILPLYAHAQSCDPDDSEAYWQSVAERPLAFAKQLAEMKRQREMFGPMTTSSSLQISVPVIAGKFSDTGVDPLSVADLDNALFGITNDLTAYFDEVSLGMLQLNGTVYGDGSGNLIQAPQTNAYYAGDVNCAGLQNNCNAKIDEYIHSLLQVADQNVDFSQYDSDGDGFVDWVAIAHPAYEWTCAHGDYDLRAHYFRLSALPSGSFVTNDIGAGGQPVVVDDYSIQSMLTCDETQTAPAEIGIWAHEFGHALGIHDLNHNPSIGPLDGGIGFWGLMGWGGTGIAGKFAGCWLPPPGIGEGNYHPDLPTHMSARTKEHLGFIAPTVLTESQAGLVLNPVETNGDCFKIYPRGGTVGSEYFLLEYRRGVGFDQQLPLGGGLVIWRVTRADQCPPDDVLSLGCRDDIGLEVVQADPVCMFGGFFFGGDHDIFPGASNVTQLDDDAGDVPNLRTKLGKATGLSISNIAIAPDGSNLTFDLDILIDDFVSTAILAGGTPSAVAWGDVDIDGDPDLYLVKRQFDLFGESDPPNSVLFSNGVTLTESPTTLLLESSKDGYSAAWADIDNDGDDDIAYVNSDIGILPKSSILRNNGCTQGACSFGNVLGQVGDYRAVAWGDIDGDGFVDLYIGGIGDHRLLRNNGTGFSDVFATSGISGSLHTQAALFSDYDDDGDADVLVLQTDNDAVLYENDGTGSFGAVTPAPFSENLSTAVWFDYDNDGDLDLYAGKSSGAAQLYRRDGGGGTGYTEVAASTGVDHTGNVSSVIAFDYDIDGHLDLYVIDYADANTLYRNLGNGTFEDATTEFNQSGAGDVAAAVGDFNVDGLPDFVLADDDDNNDSVLALYRNQTDLKHANHWLQVELVGAGEGLSNRSGIGARVEVTTSAGTQLREVASGRGNSQDWVVACFGLGADVTADVTVMWPSGVVQVVEDVSADQRIVVNECPQVYGTISSDTTWTACVELIGDVMVAEGATLTIDQGTEVNFALTDVADLEPFFADRVELHVRGTLVVNGSASEPVVFQSVSETPAANDWVHIQVLGGGSLDMDHAELRHSEWGISTGTTGSLLVSNSVFAENGVAAFRTFVAPSSTSLNNCQIEVGLGLGVELNAPGGAITDNVFTVVGSGRGIEVNASGAVISGNLISGVSSSDAGIVLDSQNADATIDDNEVSGFTGGDGIRLRDGVSYMTNTYVHHCDTGIFVKDGVHTIGAQGNGNDISENTVGLSVKCLGPGGPCPGRCDDLDVVVRYTNISTNTDGVLVDKTANVDLGSALHANWGNNNIAFNLGSCVSNLSSCGTVSAVGNYFGSCAAPTCTSGAVDTSDWLCSPAGGVSAWEPPDAPAVPARTRLVGISPNPFNPTALVRYELNAPGVTQLEVYDVAGHRIQIHSAGPQSAGPYEWRWDGRDIRGASVSTGVYYVILRVNGDVIDTRKAVLLK